MSVFRNQFLIFAFMAVTVICLSTSVYVYTSKASILLLKSEHLHHKGENEQAFLFLDQATEASSGNLKTLERIIKNNIAFGRDDKAIEGYMTLFSLTEPSIDQIKTLVSLYNSQGKVDESIRLLTDPNYPSNMNELLKDDLIASYLQIKNFNHAILLIKEKLRDCSSQQKREDTLCIDLSLKNRLAEVLIWNKNYSEGIKVYQELLAKDPSLKQARTQLVYALAWSDRVDEAIEEFQKIPKGEQDSNIEILLIDLKLEKKDFSNAETMLREHLRKREDAHAIRLKLAELLSWQEQYTESLVQYRKVLEVYPEDIQIRRNYAMVLSWSGSHAESIKELKKTFSGER